MCRSTYHNFPPTTESPRARLRAAHLGDVFFVASSPVFKDVLFGEIVMHFVIPRAAAVSGVVPGERNTGRFEVLDVVAAECSQASVT